MEHNIARSLFRSFTCTMTEDLEQNEHTELDLEQYNIPASDSLSMAFNAARTGPIRILSCAADSRWWSWDDLKGNFNADEWSCDMTSVDSSRSLNNRWHVSLAPGSASWFSTPKNTTESKKVISKSLRVTSDKRLSVHLDNDFHHIGNIHNIIRNMVF